MIGAPPGPQLHPGLPITCGAIYTGPPEGVGPEMTWPDVPTGSPKATEIGAPVGTAYAPPAKGSAAMPGAEMISVGIGVPGTTPGGNAWENAGLAAAEAARRTAERKRRAKLIGSPSPGDTTTETENRPEAERPRTGLTGRRNACVAKQFRKERRCRRQRDDGRAVTPGEPTGTLEMAKGTKGTAGWRGRPGFKDAV